MDLTTVMIHLNANVVTNGGNVDLNATTLVDVTAAKSIITTGDAVAEAGGAVDIDVSGTGTVSLVGSVITTGAANGSGAGGAGGIVTIDTVAGAVSVGVVTSNGGAGAGDASAGNVSITSGGAGQDVTLTGQITGKGGAGPSSVTDSTVTIVSSGAVIDSHTGSDIMAGALVIHAVSGVGSADPLDTKVATVDIDNTMSGDIEIAEADDITVNQLNQHGTGEVWLATTSGSITIATSQSGVSLLSGTVTLNAGGAGNLAINAAIVTVGGNVDLDAGNNITSSAAGTITTMAATNSGITSRRRRLGCGGNRGNQSGCRNKHGRRGA